MLKIKIIALGKLKELAYREMEREFLKRLSPFAKVKLLELPEVPYGKNFDLERVKEREALAIINNLPVDGMVILLEEKGVLRNSQDFAKFVDRLGGMGRELVFVIGSGIGLHKALHEHANHVVSLSLLTFPHNLARILLEEQLYRSCTILAGKEYHK
jgi:23S rRNA (pseudouridine1915-N3)-methyltransferase